MSIYPGDQDRSQKLQISQTEQRMGLKPSLHLRQAALQLCTEIWRGPQFQLHLAN